MTLLVYLYSRWHMHHTVHGKVESFDSVWQGESRLKVSVGMFNPSLPRIGWTKKVQIGVSKNREFNSLSNKTKFSLFCVLEVALRSCGT